ncbi:MAG: hypothetical protein ACYDCK_01140 [Thermoplasmatota archaeon]
MAVVVLLRGANLGSKRFSPKAVEAALADLEMVNVGAAGTFVVRKRIAEGALRKRIAAELPWDDPEMFVYSEREVRDALAAGAAIDVPKDAIRRFATALAKKPPTLKLPIEAPPAPTWGVRVVAVEGRFVFGVRKPVLATGVYPNAVVEKAFAIRATTRDWPTMEKIGKLIEG